jgi:uncharacterized protein
VFFPVRELEIHAKQFKVEIPVGVIDFLDPKLRQAAPIRAAGKVELASGSLGEIRVTGHLDTQIEADCDRCLEKTQFPLDSDFDLMYRPVSVDFGDEKVLDEDEAQMGFYEGDGLELNEVLREFVLLTLPMQRLCSESCKGLCPVCGQSRNLSECNCQASLTDDRWAALKKFR